MVVEHTYDPVVDAAGAVLGDRPADDHADSPVQRAVAALRAVDRAMVDVLHAVATAGPVGGMPADRIIGLQAGATGWDVRYLAGCVEALAAMPGVWAAFDAGRISWSQLRGIVTAAKGLSQTDRAMLDGRLVGAVETGSEPDRLVEVAHDIAGRLDDARLRDRERYSERVSFVRLQAQLFGGVDIYGHVDDHAGAMIAEALDAAADPPAADGQRPVDADGRPVPGTWQPPTSRAGQLAEGLARVCESYLHDDRDGTSTGGGRTEALVVTDITDLNLDLADLADTNDLADVADAPPVDAELADAASAEVAVADLVGSADRADAELADLIDADPTGLASATDGPAGMATPADTRPMARSAESVAATTGVAGLAAGGLAADGRAAGGVPRATARLLWRLAGGRTRISQPRVHALTCDATFVPVLTDGTTVVAIGDAHDPIPQAVRRAAMARDQGCRFPGCNAPVRHTDLHHIIPRSHGGPTSLTNLVSTCRRCHVRLHEHHWQLTLHPDGQLDVQRGRYRFTSRPPIRPPT